MSSARKLWSYQCEWDGCNKSFKSISTFEAHYRRHTDQRPFACKYERCGQTFHDSEALDQHHQIHKDQCMLTCKYASCGRAFHDRGELIEHHRTHKQRPLACGYDSCSRTFARRESLEAHMHMHTRERPFTCSNKGCNKNFCDREGMIQHERSCKNKNVRPCGYESGKETFDESSQFHRQYWEKPEKTTTSMEEVRPIRLRLSQPKRQSAEFLEGSPCKRLLIRSPMQNNRDGSSRLDPTDFREQYSESGVTFKRSSNCTERTTVHQDARTSRPSFVTSSTSEAIGKQVSSRRLKLTQPARPQIFTPSVHTQAPALQPAFDSRSADQKGGISCTDGESSGHGVSVYTRVCGVYSREKAPPNKTKTSGGRYHCPRCDTQFTRSRGVVRHFVGCITKYGNPDSLKWTDHPSLERTAQFHARNAYKGHENSRELPKDAILGSLVPKPMSSVIEEEVECVEPVKKSPGWDFVLLKDIVQPIRKRQDALRRSKYNPETISRDVLLATGCHPNMNSLNAHLDILREKFRSVNLESNLSTFRWDLVDPAPDSDKKPKRQPEPRVEQEVEPEQSVPRYPEANKDKIKPAFDDIGCHDLAIPLTSQSSPKPGLSYHEIPFRVTLPEQSHFGPMSTIFSRVFDNDSSARLMSTNGDLWAAIFTMIERRYHEQNFIIRTAVMKSTGNVMGWIACHEVDTPQPRPEDPRPEEYLDWTTAAHLLPPQISRFTSTKGSAKGNAERSNQRKAGEGLASTIQARATEAQTYVVPIPRLNINALCVHPLYQGRGIASTLLKSIAETMDTAKRPIWIQAPEDPAVAQGVPKAGLFRRAGFTCAGELNLDLDSYASELQKGDKEKGASFGTYKWNYMLRWPRPICQKPPQRRIRELRGSV